MRWSRLSIYFPLTHLLKCMHIFTVEIRFAFRFVSLGRLSKSRKPNEPKKVDIYANIYMTIRNAPNADQCVYLGQVMQNGNPKTTEKGQQQQQRLRQRIPCKCWQNRFLTTYFFGRPFPGKISWPAGWQSDSRARIVSPLPNWLPASLCRFQQAKHVPASNLSFVFSFRFLFSSEQVDDGLV